jgi:hypothetical protein
MMKEMSSQKEEKPKLMTKRKRLMERNQRKLAKKYFI